MGTLTVTKATIVLAILLPAIAFQAGAAELRIRVEPDRFNHVFAGDPINVSVRIAALDLVEKEYVRLNAHSYVRLTVLTREGETVGVKAESGRVLRNTLTEAPTKEADGVRQNVWWFEGMVKLSGIPAGEYTLKGTYLDVTDTDNLRVWNGDEDATVRAAWLGREADRATSYEAFRELQLARLELQPHNSGILWELASHAEYEASLEETDHYYALMVDIVRANLESIDVQVSDLDAQRASFREFERVVAAVRAVLPEFYENREGLILEKPRPGTGATVHVLDRKTKKVLKSIDGYSIGTQPSARE